LKKELLNTKNQEFITKNINSDITDLILKGNPNNLENFKELVEQIEAKKRCEKKLPTWFNAKHIYYPNKLNIEQTSSEITAKYKSSLVSGESLIDLTGGFGIDCYYFSKNIKQVTHCEINEKLSDIVKHNYEQLEVKNITCIAKNGIDTLKQLNTTLDCIYIDPSRRHDRKGKVFLLKDCLPNVPENLNLFFDRSTNIIIKTSPLLDISSGISELKYVSSIHIIAVNNEVKELLWVLEKGYSGDIKIKAVNLKKDKNISFNFPLNEEKLVVPNYSAPLAYLYEPNAAILKAGAFNSVSKQLDLFKLHKHSHLYTSNTLMNFPGRFFKIEHVIPYNRKVIKTELKLIKANITVRNFPETVKQIREKFSIKDGGHHYLFFTTDLNNNKIIISTIKID